MRCFFQQSVWDCLSWWCWVPNPRLQRTASAAPPAPLSRKSLGRTRQFGRLLASVVLAISGCASRPNLQARIQQLVGPGATDCGHVGIGSDTAAANACAVAAFESRHAFWVRYDRAGIDSHLETVFLCSAAGNYFKLEYDSDIRGSASPATAKPRLTTESCAATVSLSPAGVRVFGCE